MAAPRLPARINATGASLTPSPKVARLGVALEQTPDRATNDLQRKGDAANAQARASVLADHNLIQAVAFQAGVTKLIAHGLSNPLTGVVCTMVNSGAPAPSFSKGTLPRGVDAKRMAALVCNVTGNYDLLVHS